MSEAKKEFVVRLDAEMHAWLTERAEEQGRSLAGHIRYLLKKDREDARYRVVEHGGQRYLIDVEMLTTPIDIAPPGWLTTPGLREIYRDLMKYAPPQNLSFKDVKTS